MTLDSLSNLRINGKRTWKPGRECYYTILLLLLYEFGERVISRNGAVGWPPRSCDLTPLDYFLSSYDKSMVYANKPALIDELRTNIERELAAVSADLCLKIVKNWVQRLDFCKRANLCYIFYKYL